MLDQKVSYSVGENERDPACQVVLQGANLLILDEPTNDLISHLESFWKSFAEFGGGVLVVTHDRAF